MLWCTSTARVPKRSALSVWILWVGDTWNSAYEYESLTVLCIYKQSDLVPGKLSGDCGANHSQCLNRGDRCEEEGAGGGPAWIKTPPPANSLIQDFVFGASSPAAHLFLLSRRRQNVSHPQIKLMLVWTCNPPRRYVVRPQRPLKSSVFLFWV